jgi:trans-2,3-dihydro-3-hydroxyanthranilate isomerase
MELATEAGQTVGARLAAPQRLEIGADAAPDLVAAACSLPPGEIETRNHPPLVASCGAAFIFAELKSRAALAAAQPRADVFAERLPRDGATGIHLYVQAPEGGVDLQTRMFAPLHGIPEDPATGSANVALIGLLAHLRPEADLALSRTIGQGFDMGRPSVLQASAEKEGGRVTATHIGGRCVAMMSGTIDLR